jgi:hypothetical protein
VLLFELGDNQWDIATLKQLRPRAAQRTSRSS